MASSISITFIFGGDKPWSSSDWTASDDRVRGGSSISELLCKPADANATFCGHLDTKTLGGAGFASQRTTGEDRTWDMAKFDGILLDVTKCDEKKYTLTLKDEILPKSPNGREQSTVSWEYDFKSVPEGEKIFVYWDDFKPTYRGRERSGADPLSLKHIKRISLMMRSFFASQEGDFSLSIRSIAIFKKSDAQLQQPYQDNPNKIKKPWSSKGDPDSGSRDHSQPGWLGRLFGLCLGSKRRLE